MKIPVALTMLASPFSLPHDERWILPIALGVFTLLTVYFTWRLKTDEGDKWLFRKKMKDAIKEKQNIFMITMMIQLSA